MVQQLQLIFPVFPECTQLLILLLNLLPLCLALFLCILQRQSSFLQRFCQPPHQSCNLLALLPILSDILPALLQQNSTLLQPPANSFRPLIRPLQLLFDVGRSITDILMRQLGIVIAVLSNGPFILQLLKTCFRGLLFLSQLRNLTIDLLQARFQLLQLLSRLPLRQ